MFTLRVLLRDEDDNTLDGIVSAYSADDRVLEVRDSTVNGDVTLDLVGDKSYIFTVVSARNFESHLIVLDSGQGDVTFTCSAVSTMPPIDENWCSIEGKVVDIIGSPLSLNIKLSIKNHSSLSTSMLTNRSTCVSTDSSGNIRIQMLRNSEYLASIHLAPYESVPANKIIYTPNKSNASFYDVFFPYAVGVSLDKAYTGEGSYGVSIILSDGRSLSDYSAANFISIVSENVYAEIVEEEGKMSLQVSGLEQGGAVRVYSNRWRGDQGEERFTDTVRTQPLASFE